MQIGFHVVLDCSVRGETRVCSLFAQTRDAARACLHQTGPLRPHGSGSWCVCVCWPMLAALAAFKGCKGTVMDSGLAGSWEGDHESRRCSRDTYLESYAVQILALRSAKQGEGTST